MVSALELKAVSAGYGETVVLEDINLSVAPGESISVIGRNGVGKTSLLRAIVGHRAISAGSISFDGRDIGGMRPYARAGLGIALLAPWGVAEEVAAGALVPVLPGWRAEPRDVHAAWAGGHSLPRRVRAVLDLLVEKAAAEPRLKAR